MNIHQLNEAEQAFYDEVLERNIKKINKKKNVIGVGVGYKIAGGKLTNTVCITAAVNKKNSKTNARDRIPDEIDGVPTDIIALDELEDQLLGMLDWFARGKYFSTIRGGVEIHNRELCRVNSTALGCVVYDKMTGQPLGLTAQHGIGYIHKPNSRHKDADSGCNCDFCSALRAKRKTRGYLRTAKVGDPINQPNSYSKKETIGELFKVNEKLDLALIKIKERKCENRIEGIVGEINNPVIATIGTPVECSSRHTHSKGLVFFRGYSHWYPGRTILKIAFDPRYAVTRSGDSGGLWLEQGTRKPVGIHTSANVSKRVAIATCISQLKEFHPVTFQPPQFREMVKSLKLDHTTFVKAKNGNILVFCNRIGDVSQTNPLKVVKFDKDYKRINTKRHNIRPVATGVAAGTFKSKIYCAWRSANSDQIQTARLTNKLTFDSIKKHPLRTRFKPALCTLKTCFLLLYTDLESETLDFATSINGKTFSPYDLESAKVCSAPAATSFGNHVIVAWIDKNSKRVLMKKLSMHRGGVYHQPCRKISRVYQPVGDPALASGWETNQYGTQVEWLYLAFTTQAGELQILKRTHGENWRPVPKTAKWSPVPNSASPSKYSPTLLHHNGRVIWTRQSPDKNVQ